MFVTSVYIYVHTDIRYGMSYDVANVMYCVRYLVSHTHTNALCLHVVAYVLGILNERPIEEPSFIYVEFLLNLWNWTHTQIVLRWCGVNNYTPYNTMLCYSM